jgi:uncharacterized protein YdeI (YjbR/CyaY-like superfamily)
MTNVKGPIISFADQLAKFDEHYFLVRMTPRRSASRWSAINRDTAERLIREARMQPAGLSEVHKAMAVCNARPC